MTAAHSDLDSRSATILATAHDFAVAVNSVHPCTEKKDTTLPMLAAIRFEVAGDHLMTVATDRYVLGSYLVQLTDWHPDNGPQPEIETHIDRADAQRLVKFALAGDKVSVLEWTLTATSLAVALPDGNKLTVQAVQGGEPFPRFRQLFGDDPSTLEGHRIGLGAHALTALMAAHKAVQPAGGGSRLEPVILWPQATSGNTVAVSIGDRFVGLVAPFRVGDASDQLDLDRFRG